MISWKTISLFQYVTFLQDFWKFSPGIIHFSLIIDKHSSKLCWIEHTNKLFIGKLVTVSEQLKANQEKIKDDSKAT